MIRIRRSGRCRLFGDVRAAARTVREPVSSPPMPYRDLQPRDVHAELNTDSQLEILDVRTPPEFAMHYVVLCQHGIRSAAACEFLSERGFEKLTNVVGGMSAWVAAGLPHTSG